MFFYCLISFRFVSNNTHKFKSDSMIDKTTLDLVYIANLFCLKLAFWQTCSWKLCQVEKVKTTWTTSQLACRLPPMHTACKRLLRSLLIVGSNLIQRLTVSLGFQFFLRSAGYEIRDNVATNQGAPCGILVGPTTEISFLFFF